VKNECTVNEPLIIFVNVLFEQQSKFPGMAEDMEKSCWRSIHANVFVDLAFSSLCCEDVLII